VNETRRALLDALAAGPVHGPALADRLGVSRAAVRRQVGALRAAGFGIERDDDGYRVVAVPAYGAAAVAYELDAPYRVEHHERLPSTNDRGRELAAAGESDVVVLADEQTGGRGRLDREWASPRGGAWLSVVCRPDLAPAQAPLYTLAAAVATARAAREAGVDARIKWPNDVVVPRPDGTEAKLAGVLTETEAEADRVSWLVVGVGANVNVDVAALPAGVDATSVRAEAGGGDVPLRAFVARLLETFDGLRGDRTATLAAWRERSSTLGRRVRVETARGPVVGEAVDVTGPGALVVRTAGGERTVHAGDCEHLRPSPADDPD
jgi:BirA family biotin operon repressor/biotin-[acetyl-CoA-carboxylase] ligase